MLTYEKQIKTRRYKLVRPAAAERMFCLPTSISSNDVRGSGSSAEWDFPTPTTATWAWSWENQYHLLPWLHKACLLLLFNHFSYLCLVSFPGSQSLLSRVGVWQSRNETNVAWFQHFSTYIVLPKPYTVVSRKRAHSERAPTLYFWPIFLHRVKVYLNKHPPWSALRVEFEKHRLERYAYLR